MTSLTTDSNITVLRHGQTDREMDRQAKHLTISFSLRFYSHFPGGPGLAGTRISPI